MKKHSLIKSALSPQKLVGSALGAAKKFRKLSPAGQVTSKGNKLMGQIKTFGMGAVKSIKDKFSK